LVVLVALTWNAFTFLDTFNLPIIQEARKLVYTNSLQIREDFRKFEMILKCQGEGISLLPSDSQ
jgi:hypothetical protein